MKYMLDTNILVYVKNAEKDSPVRRALMKRNPDEMCISAITLAEIEYGISNSSRVSENREAFFKVLSDIKIVPFDENAAVEYGVIRFHLKKNGTPIGANDMLIAAHAKSLDLTLITNNTKEFERVPGLKIENWV